jgi:ketosteroid isomerase-like protein
MSQEDVEIVQRIYDAWSAGESAARWIDPQMEYVNPENAVEPGTVRDRRALLRVRETYRDFVIEPERFIDAGDEVVVIGAVRARGEAGPELHGHQGYVWTVRDGRAIRFRWFNDPAEALEAVGLSE